MAIKTFENVYVSSGGHTSEVVCPVCNELSKISIISSADYGALTLILAKSTQTDFGVCPKCSSVFSIKEEYLQAKASGTTVFLTPDDLTLLVKGK